MGHTFADLSKLEGPYIESTPRRITKDGLRANAAQVLPAGSVLLSSRAPIGHVAINTEPMGDQPRFQEPHSATRTAWTLSTFTTGCAHTEYLQSLGNLRGVEGGRQQGGDSAAAT